jgi:hypothetical protein
VTKQGLVHVSWLSTSTLFWQRCARLVLQLSSAILCTICHHLLSLCPRDSLPISRSCSCHNAACQSPACILPRSNSSTAQRQLEHQRLDLPRTAVSCEQAQGLCRDKLVIITVRAFPMKQSRLPVAMGVKSRLILTRYGCRFPSAPSAATFAPPHAFQSRDSPRGPARHVDPGPQNQVRAPAGCL